MSAVPQRVQRRREKGWTMPQGAVYVGRGTRWGNPFKVERATPWPRWAGRAPWRIVTPDGREWEHEENRRPIVGRDAADIARYAAAVRGAVDLYALHTGPMGDYELDPAEVRAALAGRDLACWCPLDQPCHADVLLGIANPASAERSPR